MNIERMQRLTKDLIAIDSVTGREKEIGDYLITHLGKRGMSVQSFVVTPDRKNILATWGREHPRVLFNTHMDTVPEQYGPYEDDRCIFGRGACDTHGVLAAQLEALEELRTAGVVDAGILVVVGEETMHDGAIHAAQCRDLTEPDVLIVGEPTENKLMISQKGRLKADLTAFGKAGHSGYPENYDSAVEKLFLFLEALWQASWLARHSDEGTTVNVTLHSNPGADNQVPPIAGARLMFRCAEACSVIRAKVERVFQDVEKTLPGPELQFQHYKLQWLAGSVEPLKKLAQLPGFITGTAAFNTDIDYLGWDNARTFLTGPGSILVAHRDLVDNNWQDGEWIAKQEQVAGARLYKKLVLDALGLS